MIKSFHHKGLKKFLYHRQHSRYSGKPCPEAPPPTGPTQRLCVAEGDGFSRMGFHSLKGALASHYAVSISGNWRLTFKFEDGDAILVDYQDYH